MRQYALEKLGESGEADAVRARHRDHYTAMAAAARRAAQARDYEQRLEQAEIEIDNLRAAFAWSRENVRYRARVAARVVAAAAVARAGPHPGRAGLVRRRPRRPNAQHAEVAPAVRARALADKAVLDALMGAADSMDQAEQALAIAREVDDPALLARALTACGCIAAVYNAEVARPYFAEAIGLARAVGDRWRLSQILGWQAYGGDRGG